MWGHRVFVNGRSRAGIMEDMRARVNRADAELERRDAIKVGHTIARMSTRLIRLWSRLCATLLPIGLESSGVLNSPARLHVQLSVALTARISRGRSERYLRVECPDGSMRSEVPSTLRPCRPVRKDDVATAIWPQGRSYFCVGRARDRVFGIEPLGPNAENSPTA